MNTASMNTAHEAAPRRAVPLLCAVLLLFAAAFSSRRVTPAPAALASACAAISREGECKEASSCEWHAVDATCVQHATGSGIVVVSG